jgi:hypothetical protein
MKWFKKILEATSVGNPFTRIVPPPPVVIESPKTPRFDATGRRFPTTTTRLYMVMLQTEGGYMSDKPSRVATSETLPEMVERVFAEADPKDRQYGSVKIIRMELEVPQVILDTEDA